MSEAEEVTTSDRVGFDRAAEPRSPTPANDVLADDGPPTVPTPVVQPTMRPDPALPDPLSGTPRPPTAHPQTPPQAAQPARPQAAQAVRSQAPQRAQAVRSQAARGAQTSPVAGTPVRPQAQPAAQPRAEQSRPGPAGLQTAVTRPLPSPSPTPQSSPQPSPTPQPAPANTGTGPSARPAQQQYGAEIQRRRSSGHGPGADHRQAVAQQWADPRSARPPMQVKSQGRRRKDAKEIQKHRTREAKWAANRWAVPYFTDGPKLTFGVLWFVLLAGGALLGFNYDNAAVSSVAVALVTSVVAGLAGLQTGFAWFPKNPATRTWTAVAAFVTGISGFYGPWGVLIGLVLGFLILTVYLIIYRGHRRSAAQLFDVLSRSAIPVGLASASLGAMAFRNLPVLIALILLVSAYEVGDFLVGSGAFNPVEGPMAGLIAAGVVAFFLFLIQPDPFSSETIIMFVVVAGICCIAGQYLASALLPRGNAWAPALRRLDSYLLAAPLWLLLLVLLPDLH